jgi:hypothetical protein
MLQRLLMFITACALLLDGAQDTAAQNAAQCVLFTARIDTNQNDAVDQQDTAQWYQSDGVVSTTALTTIEQGNVVRYAARTDVAAFVTQAADGSGAPRLHVTTSDGTQSTDLDGTVTDLALGDGLVWAVVLGETPRLRGYALSDLSIAHERAMNLADTVVRVYGAWAFAYNPSGALDVFSLPSLDVVDFPLADLAYSTPTWSPTGAQLQFIAADAATPTDLYLSVLNFETTPVTAQRFDLLDDLTSDGLSFWSDHGRYIVSSTTPDSLTFTQVSDGAQQTLTTPNATPAALSWAFDDAAVLYSLAGADGTVSLFVYDPASGQSTPISDPTLVPIALRWSPNSARLAMVAQYAGEARYGVFTADAPYTLWLPQLSTSSGATMQINWLGDAKTLIVEQSGGVFTLDTEFGTLARLSDQNVVLVDNSLRLGPCYGG